MTSPAGLRGEPVPAYSPVSDAPEISPQESPAELALRRDQIDLQREVILWQRWLRYSAVAVLTAVALLLGSSGAGGRLPVVVVALVYTAFVVGSAWVVSSRPATKLAVSLPAVLLTADVAMIGALFYASSSPQQMHRVLLIGFLAVQLSVFYFGRRLGAYAGVLVAVMYVVLTEFAPAYVGGVRPSRAAVGFNVALFALVVAVLVMTFGRFRARMNQLRLYCALLDEGEKVGMVRLTDERWPDDLTLLARSLDAMRTRMAEQIGSDPLTGCMNRRALETRLRAEWRQAKRRGSHVAVLAIDLDHFKEINDSRGHPTGDQVLQQLAGIMKATARDTDAVARLGGDEFVIVLPDTGWQGAMTFAERLRRRVDDFSFGVTGKTFSITISVGVALARGTDPLSADALLHEADRALYKAKTGGRNRVYA